MKRMLMLPVLVCLLFGVAIAQDVETDAEKLERLRLAAADYEDADTIAGDALREYAECHELKDKPEFAELLPKLAKRAAAKAEEASWRVKARVGLRLNRDEYDDLAKPLLQTVCDEMQSSGKSTKEVREKREDGTTRIRLVPDPLFIEVVEALGWQEYHYPEEMNLAIEYGVEGAMEYAAYYNFDVDQRWHDIGWFPPDVYEKLKELEETSLRAWEELALLDQMNGFALRARKSWLRFRNAQDSRARVDRQKGKRSFSPTALGRESEKFDDIWTYDYARPCIAFVEKPVGKPLPEGFEQLMQQRLQLLQAMHDWFREHLIDGFNLQRVKPQYNAEIAEKEGWGFELVFLKDLATFEKYCADVMGEPIPGAQAFYSPMDERVITYMEAEVDDDRGLQQSVHVHEVFHMLSDHYTANPQFTIEEMHERPRFSSLLVQEGLTDAVAGVAGSGKTARFYQLNHLRLDEFESIYELLDDRVLFRIRDTIQCRHNGQCEAVAGQRAQELKINPVWAMGNAMGFYYPTVCQMAYFFQYFKKDGKHVYRAKWWSFLKDEYTGQHALKNYADTAGIDAFKKAFDIEDDADWDALEKEFLEFTLALEPDDVDNGGDSVEPPDQD